MTIFEFPGDLDLSVAYTETMIGMQYVEDVAQVRACTLTCDRIASKALPSAETAAFVAAISEEMRR